MSSTARHGIYERIRLVGGPAGGDAVPVPKGAATYEVRGGDPEPSFSSPPRPPSDAAPPRKAWVVRYRRTGRKTDAGEAIFEV